MNWTRRLLRRLPKTILIVGVAMVTTWLAASAALSGLKPEVLAADLRSSLEADYGPSETEALTLLPVDNAIADSVAQDELARSSERGASEVVFAPIFLAGEGNQEPVRLPSGEVEPVPTPLPTQPGYPTATPTPLQPDQPTQEPKATKAVQSTSTPKPQPTQPDHPTPQPKPTTVVQPTSTPRPTKTDRPTSTPKPAKTVRPTSTPKPKPTQANDPSTNP